MHSTTAWPRALRHPRSRCIPAHAPSCVTTNPLTANQRPANPESTAVLAECTHANQLLAKLMGKKSGKDGKKKKKGGDVLEYKVLDAHCL